MTFRSRPVWRGAGGAPALLVAAAALLPGCSEDQGPTEDPIGLEDLVGEWTAISLLYTTGEGREFDVIASGGEAEISVPPSGLTHTRIALGNSVDEWDALWVVFEGGVLRSFPAEWQRPVRTRLFRLVGDELTLIDGDVTFDFSRTGQEGIPAREEMVLVRHRGVSAARSPGPGGA